MPHQNPKVGRQAWEHVCVCVVVVVVVVVTR